MTLLVISPDYASHLLPLATVATAWRDEGDRVVVATGQATAPVVASFGFEHHPLTLGRGSNPGVIRAEQQVLAEDVSLRGFFAATRRGAVPTLLYQAGERLTDLLWNPIETARAVLAAVQAVQPDQIIVDHLAFSARLALSAAGLGHGDVVLGHPSALPVGDEVYGNPPAWPECIDPTPAERVALLERCRTVRDRFTEQWNAALAVLAPGAPAVADAFATRGPHVLLNYPGELHDPRRTESLGAHTFLGSCVRSDQPDTEVMDWLAADTNAPVVYVSFGSFLSARSDVLARVASALRGLEVRVALAVGSADPAVLGGLPGHWLVREYLPQVALLQHSDLAVTHGGNNSVTEALTYGVPMVVLPFSTDQFAGAASLERAGLAAVLDPNAATPRQLRSAVERVLDGNCAKLLEPLGQRLRTEPGPIRARAALRRE